MAYTKNPKLLFNIKTDDLITELERRGFECIRSGEEDYYSLQIGDYGDNVLLGGKGAATFLVLKDD